MKTDKIQRHAVIQRLKKNGLSSQTIPEDMVKTSGEDTPRSKSHWQNSGEAETTFKMTPVLAEDLQLPRTNKRFQESVTLQICDLPRIWDLVIANQRPPIRHIAILHQSAHTQVFLT